MFPSGGLYFEVIRISTAAATSVDALLTFTSSLRMVENIQWGKLCTPSLATDAAITWTNATTYPGHAEIGVSGISTTAAEKTFDIVSWGKV